MNRGRNLNTVRERSDPWDIIIIGGGATGAGCALDAASRGFSVLLLEQHDFGKGTSSRSTKLIHGGVRYLKQGNIALVREALKERGLLLKNAPHAVTTQAFVIPCYNRFEKFFYGFGMKVYDRLAGRLNIGTSQTLSRDETVERLPTVNAAGLAGSVLYYDGRFDDARFLIDLLRTADSHRAVVLNYSKVDSFQKDAEGRITGVEFVDAESGERFTAASRTVINAAGIFSDAVRQLSESKPRPLLTFARGIHIVLARKFLPSADAVMIPKTSDGRVLFCIPWNGHTVIGTTDAPVSDAILEPAASEAEIDFVLETAGQYLTAKPSRIDILSVFARIRPLIRSNTKTRTSALSRGHELFVDRSGLVTITGGKWTTYRRMAEDAVNKAIETGGLQKIECRTENLSICPPEEMPQDEKPHPALPYTRSNVIRAVRSEMARTVEDVLARRTRILFLDARAAIEIAPAVAAIIAAELGKSDGWAASEVAEFNKLAANYLAR